MGYAPFDLTGKVALVTGGNRGIGLGMAEALAAAGAAIVIWGRDASVNAAAVEKLNGCGAGRVMSLEVDVSDEDAVGAGMRETVSLAGRIDCCVANAGVGVGAPSFPEMSTEIWRRNMAVNLDGAFWTIREAVAHMVSRAEAGDPGGSIIGVASLVARQGAPRNEAYAVSKAGLCGLIRGVAVEHARHGVRANSVLPGWIATEMTEGLQQSDAGAARVLPRVPARRWGTPEDFGGVAVYLASDASRFHTGDELLLDGGYAIF